VNNGNWQWAASVGTNYRLRIYNPYLQAKKHDGGGTYMHQWIPELRHVDASVLTSADPVDFSTMAAYPPPMVERITAYRRAKEAFATARARHKETKV